MFNARFFAARYYAPRYWPKVGADAVATLGTVVLSRAAPSAVLAVTAPSVTITIEPLL